MGFSAGNTGDNGKDLPQLEAQTDILQLSGRGGSCSTNKRGNHSGTDVNAPARLLLSINEVLHPVDIVEPQGDSGDEALQRDLDGQAKVLL